MSLSLSASPPRARARQSKHKLLSYIALHRATTQYAPEQGHGESRRGGFEAAPLSDVMHDLTGLLSHWALGLSAKDKKHSKTDVRMRGGSALTPEVEFEEDVAHRTSNVEPETQRPRPHKVYQARAGFQPCAAPRRESAGKARSRRGRLQCECEFARRTYFTLLYRANVRSRAILEGARGPRCGGGRGANWEVRITKSEQIRGDTAAATAAQHS